MKQQQPNYMNNSNRDFTVNKSKYSNNCKKNVYLRDICAKLKRSGAWRNKRRKDYQEQKLNMFVKENLKQEKEGLPRTEAKHVCERKLVFCTMQSKSRHILKSALSRVENGTAISLSFGATLRTTEKSQDRKIETHIALSQKNETETVEEGKTHITLKTIIESPMLRKTHITLKTIIES